jgi:hypothetical protein
MSRSFKFRTFSRLLSVVRGVGGGVSCSAIVANGFSLINVAAPPSVFLSSPAVAECSAFPEGSLCVDQCSELPRIGSSSSVALLSDMGLGFLWFAGGALLAMTPSIEGRAIDGRCEILTGGRVYKPYADDVLCGGAVIECLFRRSGRLSLS